MNKSSGLHYLFSDSTDVVSSCVTVQIKKEAVKNGADIKQYKWRPGRSCHWTVNLLEETKLLQAKRGFRISLPLLPRSPRDSKHGSGELLANSLRLGYEKKKSWREFFLVENSFQEQSQACLFAFQYQTNGFGGLFWRWTKWQKNGLVLNISRCSRSVQTELDVTVQRSSDGLNVLHVILRTMVFASRTATFRSLTANKKPIF